MRTTHRHQVKQILSTGAEEMPFDVTSQKATLCQSHAGHAGQWFVGDDQQGIGGWLWLWVNLDQLKWVNNSEVDIASPICYHQFSTRFNHFD